MPERPRTLKVGDMIWEFDHNRRRYPKDGGVTRSPIYREHWRPVEIIGETSRSWIVGKRKVPKTGEHRGFAFSEQEVDDDCWLHEHRPSISSALYRVEDVNVLRQVAEIIGWKP